MIAPMQKGDLQENVPLMPDDAWTRRGTAGTVLLVALFWAALNWAWLSGALTIPWDAKAHFQPQFQFLANSLAKGELPFWLSLIHI